MTKTIIAALITTLSFSTLATGSIYCSTPDTSVEIAATTGRVPGNPIVGEVLVNTEEETKTYVATQVVGYWNMGETFQMALVDEQAMQFDYLIEAKFIDNDFGPYAVGTLKLADGSVLPLTCEF